MENSPRLSQQLESIVGKIQIFVKFCLKNLNFH